MNVSAILNQNAKGIETIGPEATIETAAKKLNELNIGSLVVIDERGHVLATLAERDIVRGMALSGARAVSLSVGEVAGKALVCTPDVEVDHVMRVMTENRARHLVVMIGDRMEGVLSIGDILHSRLDFCEIEVGVLRDHSRMRGSGSALDN